MSRTDCPPEPASRLSDVRAVTDTEVGFFQENGWVLLRNLVDPDLCRQMLERGRPRVASLLNGTKAGFASAEEKRAHMTVAGATDGTITNNAKWVEWRGATRSAKEEAFTRAATHPVIGHNVQRLLGRDRPVRIYHDILMCKLPDQLSTPTGWHQDSTNFPIDRNALTIWIALDEITSDQGSLQFFSGTHRCGLLGKIAPDPSVDLLDEYPELGRYAVSPAPHLQPGDATVHHGLTVHGAGPNNTPRQRWSYAVCYFPADARYTGAPNHDTDGFDLKIGEPVAHPSFVLVPSE